MHEEPSRERKDPHSVHDRVRTTCGEGLLAQRPEQKVIPEKDDCGLFCRGEERDGGAV